MKIHLFFTILFFLIMKPAKASLHDVHELSTLAKEAEAVMRVQVVNSYVLENNSNHLFYTYYNLKIFDIFSGDSLSIPLMIHGGAIANRMQRSSAEYYAAEGEILLICVRKVFDFRGEAVWRPVNASAGLFSEGFIHSAGRVALNQNIIQAHDISLSIAGFIKSGIIPLPLPYTEKALVLIRSMSPLNIHAGNGEILTIDGFGFGDFFVPGSLSFRDANKGGVQYFPCPPDNVISWSDKQIRVKVPAGAGSGQVIIDNGANAATSSSSLTINWGLINTGNPDAVYPSAAVKINDNGGYEILINERFQLSSDYRAAFERAMQTWRCQSMVNFTIKGESSIAGTASDEKNVVSWDDYNQLDPGVIGLCYCYYASCEQGKWYLEELDLIFKENVPWHSGADMPSPQTYDFETVALHELGHAQQLSHVINQNDLMHYSLAKGQAQKVPGNFNLDGVGEWFRLTESWNSCSVARMQKIPASVCNNTDFGFYSPLAYPNPCSNILILDFYLSSPGDIKIEGFDLRGRRIFSLNDSPDLPGKYSYPIDLESLSISAGIYLLYLNAPGYSQTKKILKY